MSFTPVRFNELCEDGEDDVAPDLESVKALAARLKLQTRRPSYHEWAQRVQARPWAKTKTVTQEKRDTPKNSVCGFSSVEEALEWLRKELVSEDWENSIQHYPKEKNYLKNICTERNTLFFIDHLLKIIDA